MKTITVQQFEGIIADIVRDREEVARLQKEPFEGVSRDTVLAELRKRLGEGWVLKREQPFKLTKEDLTAVASNRFYKKTGVKLLMLWAILILGLFMLTHTWQLIPLYVMYGLVTVASLAFVFVYASKQRKAKQELWRSIEGGRVEGMKK